ncbi:two-component system, sensor histidine kinase YesM [Paenibacillus sp. 1_12]|uniref:cache domain-containing sensor histidine kinase n=1 Tax=Paenibacillus sp. 1_12 TaxID=1566278 RepID=UPI0008E604D5|nr:sensor histidine kinase [Paenibacillus sp. 1_12]SFK81620.1 two-component system, sensor histidine kinase YesM [Paenibacillus sp. 1_12]
MPNWLRTLSLSNKLVLTILVCLVLPSIVSVNVSNLFTRDVIRSQVTENSQEAMRVVNQFAAGQIKNMVYVMNFVQFDEELQLSIRELGRMNESTTQGDILYHKQKISKRLDTVINSLGHLNVTILLPNKEYVASYSTFSNDPRAIFDKSWFQDIDKVSGYNVMWVGAEPNDGLQIPNKPYLLTAAKPLRTNASTYGYVIVSSEMDAFQQLFDQYKANEVMVIIDRQGRVVVDKDYSSIGTPFPYFEQLPTSDSFSFPKVAGEEFILLSEQITPEWQIVSVSPYKKAAQKIESFRQTDFLIQLLFLILFAVILLYMVRALTKPIAKLVQTVVQIESGQLSERSNITGGDEVGRLGYVFDRMIGRIERMIKENLHEQELKRKAELAMLQAQINPHFLFNVLNSIRLKIIMKGDEENAELISSLSSVLRMTINRNNEFIMLHEEIEINEHYIRLLNSRHGDRVVLHIEAASDTLMLEVPRFMLQPLIENAYIHGLKSKPGEIIIASRKCEDGRLQVEIRDSGIGMTAENLATLKAHLEAKSLGNTEDGRKGLLSGIGIHNVFERLKLIYGNRFEYDIESMPDQGTSIVLRFPDNGEKGEKDVFGYDR